MSTPIYPDALFDENMERLIRAWRVRDAPSEMGTAPNIETAARPECTATERPPTIAGETQRHHSYSSRQDALREGPILHLSGSPSERATASTTVTRQKSTNSRTITERSPAIAEEIQRHRSNGNRQDVPHDGPMLPLSGLPSERATAPATATHQERTTIEPLQHRNSSNIPTHDASINYPRSSHYRPIVSASTRRKGLAYSDLTGILNNIQTVHHRSRARSRSRSRSSPYSRSSSSSRGGRDTSTNL